ncbi:MAG: PEP-CTERM sorting domain-containing protein [Gammaproteobacteria bacterium]|nr:PEP-CTERM sorting domain-containing protein [Gammaproteobacteria bacterium]
MKKLTKLMLVLAQLGLMGAVQAASVSLSPLSQPVMLGDSVSFDVNVDFTDPATIGGRFQLSYDASILGFTSFTYNSSFTSGLTTVAYTQSSGLIDNLGFVGSVSSAGTLGTVTFSTLNTGNANLATAAYSNAFYRFRNSTGTSFIAVTYGGATAQVSAVPVPAALWLMGSGLSALGLGLRRRRA